jgi:hypothetical protein
MQSSASNATLSALLNRDSRGANGAGVGAFLVKDLNGTTLFSAAAAWVKGFPEQEFGKSVGSRSWEIECATLEGIMGGAL